MLITITNEQKVLVTLDPKTAAGAPASIDGNATFEVTSGDATVEVVDATSAWLISGTNVGNSTISVSADADLGEGVATLTDTIDLAVVSAAASTLALVAGTPELK